MASLSHFKLDRLIPTWNYDNEPAKAPAHIDKVATVFRQVEYGDEIEAFMDYKLDRNTAAQTQQPSFLSGEDWEVPEEEEELELDPGARFPGRFEDDGESDAGGKRAQQGFTQFTSL